MEMISSIRVFDFIWIDMFVTIYVRVFHSNWICRQILDHKRYVPIKYIDLSFCIYDSLIWMLPDAFVCHQAPMVQTPL